MAWLRSSLWDVPGNFYCYGSHAYKFGTTTAWEIVSDARIKDVTGDFTDGLAVALALEPRTFTYNELAPEAQVGQEGIGFIAQEIEGVAPYLVNLAPEGLGLDPQGPVAQAAGKAAREPIPDLRVYDGTVLPLVLLNAIKELAARVEKLEAQLAAA